ncbi:type II toxin-antitoxin system HicA family toxin [Acinetobacter dispersus]|uniref:type II toxin-antitoxin system HicA family toxin n=1 Tax=Acinetobacter dispersus TaxID=70348 RepID=UPI00132EADD7|nr:type II toxin-antitoxin system HicA family toxin [Acinetobacter dispersus]QHH99222.1 type II toxin-antitoxin system HicA family toxin [Acinetobacter dispersus]
MKYSEFERWLKQQGVTVVRSGKGSHRIVEYEGKQTTLPFHKGKEIGEGLRKEIIKQLGL